MGGGCFSFFSFFSSFSAGIVEGAPGVGSCFWLFGVGRRWFSAGAWVGYRHSWLSQFLDVPVPSFLVLCYVSPFREAAIALEALLCSHLSCFLSLIISSISSGNNFANPLTIAFFFVVRTPPLGLGLLTQTGISCFEGWSSGALVSLPMFFRHAPVACLILRMLLWMNTSSFLMWDFWRAHDSQPQNSKFNGIA